MSKEEFRSLVDLIAKNTGLTQEQMAVEMGYGKNYISDSLSPTGKVSQKFINAFQKHFSENTNNGQNGNEEEGIDYLTLKKIYLELSASHRNFSDAHKQLSISQRLLAEENRDLRKKLNSPKSVKAFQDEPPGGTGNPPYKVHRLSGKRKRPGSDQG